MLPIQFTYLFGASLFIIPWLYIYYRRTDLRPMLFQLGMLGIVLGLIGAYFWWSRDWWQPHTITQTIVGIEDVLLSFFSVGIGSSLYLITFKKKLVINKASHQTKSIFTAIVVLGLGLFSLLFASGINSFVSTTITFILASAIFIIFRRDLLVPMVISAVLMTILVLPVYFLMIFVTPNFVHDTWLTQNLIGWYPLGIPIEEYVFYLVAGAVSFCAYPFYANARLANIESI